MNKQKECKNLSFSDCELSILRMAVDKAEEKIAKRVVNSDEVQKIIKIVEDFIKQKSLICYGGTAINNILPEEDQFYNKDVEVPDYDFFTPNALHDAKELADIYFKQGFTDVEAKSGQHHGTFKVFVNYMPIADLTHIPKEIFNALKMDSIRVAGILYAPPNFLRMSMYLELSRPAGDTSRWEKVLKRLILLNKHYPLTKLNCNEIEFQREMSDNNKTKDDEIYESVRSTLVNQGVVFFGGYAISLYSRYMPKNQQKKLEKFADFDVLSNDPEVTAEIVKERLKDIGVNNVKIIEREPVGEIVPVHYEIKVGKDTIAFIYKPIACHSYNVLDINKQKVKIATIDTMLSFYLAFLYSDRPYYNQFLERILCMSEFLYEVQQKNRLEQKGLLQRFSITCYGHQESVEEMRAEKAQKYKELKQRKNKKEMEEWFLNYRPDTNALERNIKRPRSYKANTHDQHIRHHNKRTHRRTQKRNKFLNIYGKNRRNMYVFGINKKSKKHRKDLY
jgi:hypothetical protein